MAIKLTFRIFLSDGPARPFVDFALWTFGAERCLFGGNFPVERTLVAYKALVNDIDALLADHGAGVAERGFSASAIKWYRLNG